jgi:hypothetical protein
MNSPQAPTPPDPYQTAQAQDAANLDTAEAQQIMNNTNLPDWRQLRTHPWWRPAMDTSVYGHYNSIPWDAAVI